MQVRFIRGTTVQNDGYTGPSGTLSIDTEKNQVRLHDGATLGGHLIPRDADITAIQQQIAALGISDISGLVAALANKIEKSEIGAVNGVASLGADGKVPAAQLPSYVDDVMEFADQASFPATGESGKIYVAEDTGKVWRWSGSSYVEIAASPGSTDSVTEGTTNLYYTDARARAAISVTGDLAYDPATGIISFSESVNSVNGKTGVVTITKTDVGLGNVQNYAMASEVEAQEATAPDRYMSPLNTRQLVEHMGFTEIGGEWVLDQGTIV